MSDTDHRTIVFSIHYVVVSKIFAFSYFDLPPLVDDEYTPVEEWMRDVKWYHQKHIQLVGHTLQEAVQRAYIN